MIHGTRKAINAGCACNLCTLVREDPVRRPRAATSVPTGEARRHLEALVASGWSMARLAEHLGYGTSTLYAIRAGKWQFTSALIVEDILSVRPLEAAA